MLDEAVRGERVAKAAYDAALPQLRVDLLNAQYDLRSAEFAAVVVVAGDDRQGANDTVNILHEWLDSRYLDTTVFRELTQEESERPRFWRTWMALPARGRTGIWAGGVLRVINHRLDGNINDDELEAFARHLQRMQAELVAGGTLVLKLWFHLPHAEHERRLKKAKKNPRLGWRVDELDWIVSERLPAATPLIERFLRETELPGVPWYVIDGTSWRSRNLTTGQLLRDAIVGALADQQAKDAAPARHAAPPRPARRSNRTVLDKIDLGATIDSDVYGKRLSLLQAKLYRLSIQARDAHVSSVLVFEGNDASGKGGTIRRLTRAMEAGDYRVIPTAAPTPEERRYHYLWRFWRRLPRDGQMAIFDRSWYGRVLVERVEGFATEEEWQRAYDEINDFELQIVEAGDFLAKFWLAISPEEQLARFTARQQTPYKQHKITDEDFRNREQWDHYLTAVDDMVLQTSTDFAPWNLVPANDKRYARIAVLETVVAGLEARCLRRRKARRV